MKKLTSKKVIDNFKLAFMIMKKDNKLCIIGYDKNDTIAYSIQFSKKDTKAIETFFEVFDEHNNKKEDQK